MNIIEDGCSGGATSQANDAQSFDALIVSQVVQNISKWPTGQIW